MRRPTRRRSGSSRRRRPSGSPPRPRSTRPQRELAAANRELEDALSKYTDQAPDGDQGAGVASPRAQQRLRTAQAAVPPDVETAVAPATAAGSREAAEGAGAARGADRAEQQRTGKAADRRGDTSTNWVVKLETEHADLRRAVNEQRERVESLAASVFRAQIDASQKLAEQGGRLAIVDPAFRPVQPSGPGKTIFLLAGMVLFLSLGLGFAVGLAVIDDRLYRRTDLDQLGIAVLARDPAGAGPGQRTVEAEGQARERDASDGARQPSTSPSRRSPLPAAPVGRSSRDLDASTDHRRASTTRCPAHQARAPRPCCSASRPW